MGNKMIYDLAEALSLIALQRCKAAQSGHQPAGAFQPGCFYCSITATQPFRGGHLFPACLHQTMCPQFSIKLAKEGPLPGRQDAAWKTDHQGKVKPSCARGAARYPTLSSKTARLSSVPCQGCTGTPFLAERMQALARL